MAKMQRIRRVMFAGRGTLSVIAIVLLILGIDSAASSNGSSTDFPGAYLLSRPP